MKFVALIREPPAGLNTVSYRHVFAYLVVDGEKGDTDDNAQAAKQTFLPGLHTGSLPGLAFLAVQRIAMVGRVLIRPSPALTII